MRLLMSIASLSLLVAAPLSAAGLSSTHEELSAPPGKLNAKAFRPINQQPCSVDRTNPSGNRPATTLPARTADDCGAAKALKVAEAR